MDALLWSPALSPGQRGGTMSINLENAVVVITGASSGIGQATAEAFARRGSRLVLAARNGEALEKVAETCRGLGAEAVSVVTDVTEAAAVRALADKAKAFGDIDVWVSNVASARSGGSRRRRSRRMSRSSAPI